MVIGLGDQNQEVNVHVPDRWTRQYPAVVAKVVQRLITNWSIYLRNGHGNSLAWSK